MIGFHLIELIIAFIGAEMPLFALILHMNARIVRLETTIEILVTTMPNDVKRRHKNEDQYLND